MSEVAEQPVTSPAPDETPKVRFIPRAQPFNVEVVVKKSILDAKFDAHWAEKEPTIPQHVFKRASKGFRTWSRDRVIKLLGGAEQFYRSVLIGYVGDLNQRYDNREILIWGDIAYHDQGEYYMVQGYSYLEPKVAFNTPPPEKFTVTASLPSEEDIDTQVKMRLAEYQGQNPINKDGELVAPELNDDLAITCGFENFKQMEATLRRDVENRAVREQEQISTMQVLMKLMIIASIDPVPEIWVNSRANEMISEQRAALKSDDALMAAYGAQSMQSVFNRLVSQAQHSLTQLLVLRQYGLARNIEWDGEGGRESLSNAHLYAEHVRQHILKNLLEFVDPPEEPKHESTST